MHWLIVVHCVYLKQATEEDGIHVSFRWFPPHKLRSLILLYVLQYLVLRIFNFLVIIIVFFIIFAFFI